MNSKHIFFLFLLIIGNLSLSAEIYHLDLQTAIQMARANNPDYYRSSMDLESAQASHAASRAGLYPSLQLDMVAPNYTESLSEQYTYNPAAGNYGWQWVPTGDYRYQGSLYLEQKLPTGGEINISSMLYQRDYYVGSSSDSMETEYSNVVQFKVEQPLFQPNTVRINRRQSLLNLETAKLNRQIRLRDLDYVIAVAYYNVVRAERTLELLQEDSDRWEKSVATAEAKYSAGLIPEAEVLRLQVELARRQGSLFSAYGSYLNSADNLKIALGIQLGDSISVSEEVEKLTVGLGEVESALQSSQEIRKAEIDFQNAELSYKQTRANYGINAYVQAFYNFDSKQPDLDNLTDSYEQDRGLSLTITLPLVDWNAARKQIEVSEIALRKTRFNYQQLKRTLTAGLLQAERALQSAVSRLESAGMAEELAVRSYEITMARFKSGAVTSNDLIDAQIALNQARRELLDSLVDYNIAVVKYKTQFFPGKEREASGND